LDGYTCPTSLTNNAFHVCEVAILAHVISMIKLPGELRLSGEDG
jgi:hypothetical protein